MNHIETKLIHAGEPEPRIEGSVAMPVFQSTLFETAGTPGYHDIQYIRPTTLPTTRC
jgi:cystathionine gamma-synthase/cystathionine gamma-lyase/cystathionine beta-lyase